MDIKAARETLERPLVDVTSVGIKNLDTTILSVSDINEPFVINNDRMRRVELPGTSPLTTPSRHELTLAVELHDTRLTTPMAHEHEDLALGVNCQIGRFVQ